MPDGAAEASVEASMTLIGVALDPAALVVVERVELPARSFRLCCGGVAVIALKGAAERVLIVTGVDQIR